ncbi:hypothetical protein P8C59_003337 [Phyllachora maydis]|uniref:ML-like domain-containing protein n=1 Tax=Phyllachora maydis TaxID=1825666 RepID=A0AAD9I187_9PEZI|nr:hypothetical protein P8C59_003337 [Phyllachora maydis]
MTAAEPDFLFVPRPTLRPQWSCALPRRLFDMMALFFFLATGPFLRPAAAVMVNFENCLPASYLETTPTLLQWVPLYVDAKFDTLTPDHTLVVTMWGNVTGAYNNVTLPPSNSPYWADATKTDGKIVAEPDPSSSNPKITTLHSKVDVLSYEPWVNFADFCKNSLVNASCPLGPVFNTTGLAVPYGLPSVNMSNKFHSSYAFTSFTPTFLLIYGDAQGTNIGCVSATITPDLGGLAWMLRFLPLVVLLFVGFATLFAGIFSPWGTTDVFHWTSNYGRDADLLRLVTPGFGDCLQYVQFVALTGGLSLKYPGFYPPIVSLGAWSALMFNQSLVTKSPGYPSVQDGIYHTNGTYGLHNLGQLVGMAHVDDVWAGMMVWLLLIIAAMFTLVQGAFLAQWIYRFVKRVPEEDFRAKNVPFTLGNVVRIALHYFLLPIVALSTFQLVVAGTSPAYTVALAAMTLSLIIGFSGWLLYLIITTKPRAFLFDDLPTVLLYGPLYNTYSDEAVSFALFPLLCTLLRGIAIGAVQPSGVAQVILLAICEIIQILTLHAFRPFHSSTSMNAYHTLFSGLRLMTVLLMVAFLPSLGVTDAPKGWIGYVILLIHGGVLILGFFFNSLVTLIEVLARMMGAGGDDVRGQTRGGLSKIFGPAAEAADLERPASPGAAGGYAPPPIPFTPRTDYSTRESDFYYGIRGERLNSDAPGRKLGTGPADPTGPMASAAAWLRNMLGAKSKEKGKGFEVVRSSRMPPAMRAPGGEFSDESPPEGIPVAMGKLRNGPIESDDEDEAQKAMKQRQSLLAKPWETEVVDADGSPRDEDVDDTETSPVSYMPPPPPLLPDVDAGGSVKANGDTANMGTIDPVPRPEAEAVPEVPRKSSKRTPDHSRNASMHTDSGRPTSFGGGPGSPAPDHLAPSGLASSRLPFARTRSQRRQSGSSQGATDLSQLDMQDPPGGRDEERPTSYGFVHQGSVNRVDREVDLMGSSAEVVDERK